MDVNLFPAIPPCTAWRLLFPVLSFLANQPFRVQGFGFRIWVHVLGFEGGGFRVQGLGCKVSVRELPHVRGIPLALIIHDVLVGLF